MKVGGLEFDEKELRQLAVELRKTIPWYIRIFGTSFVNTILFELYYLLRKNSFHSFSHNNNYDIMAEIINIDRELLDIIFGKGKKING